jgi:hypothetical protein
MFLPHDHEFIKQRLHAILDETGMRYDMYADVSGNTTYPLIDGQSIKFWNVFPRSGVNFDRAVLGANQFLRPYGLFLAPHNFDKTYRKLVNIYDAHGSYQGMKYVDFPSPVYSLLVKPLPTGY